MSQLRKPYVKLWAAEALLSDDLASLSDLQERVYFRLLMVASLEEPRWITPETPGLLRKCKVSAAKWPGVLDRLLSLGMVERLENGDLFVVNGPKWNEETDHKRYPSDSPEATRERKRASRQRDGHETVTTRDVSVSRVHKEEEIDKEKEEEEDAREDAHAAPPSPDDAYLGVWIPPAIRDRVIEHCMALNDRYVDAETVRAVIQCHEDLSADDIDWARKELRKAVPRKAAWPGNVREVIAKRDGVPTPIAQRQQQERIPTAEEVFEAIGNRKPVPVPDELEYLKANNPEAYERELALRERTRARLAAHMAAKGQVT